MQAVPLIGNFVIVDVCCKKGLCLAHQSIASLVKREILSRQVRSIAFCGPDSVFISNVHVLLISTYLGMPNFNSAYVRIKHYMSFQSKSANYATLLVSRYISTSPSSQKSELLCN